MAKRKQKKVRLSKNVSVKCPFCGKINKIPTPEGALYKLNCKKCKQDLEVPKSQCCLLCAYANKKCIPSLKMSGQL